MAENQTAYNLIRETPLFADLSEDEQRLLAERMRPEEHLQDEMLFARGDESGALYLVESGWVRLTSDGRTVAANLGPGSLVGEVDMLLGRVRSTGARAASEIRVWVLENRDLTELITERPEIGLSLSLSFGARIAQLREYIVRKRLKSLPFMAELRREELLTLADKLAPKKYEPGEIIIHADDRAEAMFIIEAGMVRLTVLPFGHEEESLELGEGDVFGQMALLSNKSYGIKVLALTDVVVWVLSRPDWEEITTLHPVLKANLCRSLRAPLSPEDRSSALERLRTVPLFAQCTEEALRDVARRLLLRHVPSGEWVFMEGAPGDAMYLISSGEVKVVSEAGVEGKVFAYLKAGDFFGEMSLLTGRNRAAAVRAVSDVDLWTLHRSDFDQLLIAHPSISAGLTEVLGQRLSEAEYPADWSAAPPPEVKAEVPEEKVPLEIPEPLSPEETQVMAEAVRPAHRGAEISLAQEEALPARAVAKIVVPSATKPDQPGEAKPAIVRAEIVKGPPAGPAGEAEKEKLAAAQKGEPGWFARLSVGGKLRLAILFLLFTVLCCISLPTTIVKSFGEQGLEFNPIALLSEFLLPSAPAPTETPTITPSPVLTATSLGLKPQAEPSSPTPTETAPTSTPTPAGPTETPTPTHTPVPEKSPTPTPTQKVGAKATVKDTSSLRIRGGPGTEYPIFGALGEGDTVEILGRNEEGDWLYVRLPDGYEEDTGWISAKYVETTVKVEKIALAEATPSSPPSTSPPVEEPTPTPTEVSAPAPEFKYGAPRLVYPADGAIISSGREADVTLRWEAPGELAEDEFYNVTLRYLHYSNLEYWGDSTRETHLKLAPNFLFGRADQAQFYWWVVVRKRTGWTEGGKPDGPPISPDSETWGFKWY